MKRGEHAGRNPRSLDDWRPAPDSGVNCNKFAKASGDYDRVGVSETRNFPAISPRTSGSSIASTRWPLRVASVIYHSSAM